MTTTHTSDASDTTPMVLSRDGARISYLSRKGAGPSVLIIPGALSMAVDYTVFASHLARNFTFHIIERRGRGLSGPQWDDYSIAKECDDVLAVQEATGASLLIGHSFGGLVALETARRNAALNKIAVYEPGVSVNGSIHMDWMAAYEQKLAEKKPFDAFVEFSRGTGPDRARRTPRWLMKLLIPLFLSSRERQRMLALLPQNLREHREIARLDSLILRTSTTRKYLLTCCSCLVARAG
jgi:pimeloyl-ACP methyl ester carboxylesterase